MLRSYCRCGVTTANLPETFSSLQVLTALVSSGSALLLASQKSSDDAKTIYLAGGLGMLGMLPYTVLCIMPTNKQLMSAEKKEDAQVCIWWHCIVSDYMVSRPFLGTCMCCCPCKANPCR